MFWKFWLFSKKSVLILPKTSTVVIQEDPCKGSISHLFFFPTQRKYWLEIKTVDLQKPIF